MGPEALVARLGGDEFGILLSAGRDTDEQLETAAGQITRALAAPFALDELSLSIGASIGAARFPEDGADANALLRCADIAMYTAKDAQADYKLYEPEQNRHSLLRLSVLSDFRHALSDDELVVHYQPIMALSDRSIRGAEALVRWHHPWRGILNPGEFIPFAEESDLIVSIGAWVLTEACCQAGVWRALGPAGKRLTLSVNLAARQLRQPDLVGQVAGHAKLVQGGVHGSSPR